MNLALLFDLKEYEYVFYSHKFKIDYFLVTREM